MVGGELRHEGVEKERWEGGEGRRKGGVGAGERVCVWGGGVVETERIGGREKSGAREGSGGDGEEWGQAKEWCEGREWWRWGGSEVGKRVV